MTSIVKFVECHTIFLISLNYSRSFLQQLEEYRMFLLNQSPPFVFSLIKDTIWHGLNRKKTHKAA